MTIAVSRYATTLLILACAGSSVARADDLVLVPGSSVQVPGGKIAGQISAETPTTVTIKPNTGDTREVPVDQIASITYTGQPASLPLAAARESSGALPEAFEQYKAAVAAAGDREVVAQTAAFGQARVVAMMAAADPGRVDEALGQLDAFNKKYPTSRHRGPALEWAAKLAMQKGDHDRADRALQDLSAIPWAAQRAGILKARVLSAKGQNDQALATLDKQISALPKDSPKLPEAQLVRAEVLAAAKQFAEAETTVKQVIDTAGPEAAEIQAHAYNTLGDCLAAAGKPKDALLAYLHTDILFDKDRNQHAQALAKIAQMWRLLKRDDRADEALARLKQLYPQSPLVKAQAAKP